MRAISGMRLSGLLFVLASCDTPVEVDTFTLYRNSSMDSRARVHFATFDADESASTYNMANCQMAARLLNANIRKLNKGVQPSGFWCEPGPFRQDGGFPISFDAAFPTDA
jgi:hypothetical protein